MPKRPEQVLKLVCLLLMVALGLQIARVLARGTPLKNLSVPALPALASSETNSSSSTSTNVSSTNSTNSATSGKSATSSSPVTAESKGTNLTVAFTKTNDAGATPTNTNAKTNVVVGAMKGSQTNPSSTTASTTNGGAVVGSPSHTNALSLAIGQTNASGTNIGSGTNLAGTGTNATNVALASKPRNPQAGPGVRGGPGKAPELPPAIKNRVERITQSEILGPVMRPMPMALLGIAGDEAFLRSPEGQTGLIKEGAELGTIKLLKIGTNRVLVEEKGEKKELLIFAGMGGDSLMPKDSKKEEKKESRNEPPRNNDKDTKTNETLKKS